MEMEIDEEDFAGPDVAGLIIYGYSNSRFADVPHPSEVLTAQEMQEFDDEIAAAMPSRQGEKRIEMKTPKEKPAKAKGRGKTGKQHKAKGDGNNDEQKQEAKDGGKNDEQKHEAKGGCKNDEQKHEAKGAGDEQKHEAKGGRENDEQKHEAKGAGDEQKHEAKGGGKNDEQKHELKRKLSVFLDDRSLSTPPATAKEAPGSDPLQKKAKAPRKGKGKGSKRASTGKGRGLEKAEDAEVPDKSTDNHEQEDSEVLAKSADDDSLLDTADDEPVASPKGAGKKGNNKKRGAKPRTVAQEAAAAKSQAVADKNLLVIRQLASQHPELQPQLGFTNKILGKLS
eukprot:s421_g2.t1